MRRNVGSLKELKETPGCQSARTRGPQAYNCRKLNMAGNVNELKSGFSAEPPNKSLAG